MARLSPGSVNKSLTALKSIWAWAYKETEFFDDHPDVVNPFTSISVADNRTQEEKRVPLTAEEMNLIFGAEFQELSGADRWIPLIALYSGAALEEIGQLEVADVRQDGKVWYFAMTTMNQRGERIQSLKSEDRKRTVPLHPELIRLGFLNYLDDRKRAGDERLFPELKRNSKGKLTAQFSKRFGRRLRKLGISDQRKVFYSLRHTFKMAAQRAMVPEDLQEALDGPQHQDSLTGSLRCPCEDTL